MVRDKRKNSAEKDSRLITASDTTNDRIQTLPKTDMRKHNRGASIRTSFTSREKVQFVDSVEEYLTEFERNNDRTVMSYFRDIKACRPSEVQKMSIYKW